VRVLGGWAQHGPTRVSADGGGYIATSTPCVGAVRRWPVIIRCVCYCACRQSESVGVSDGACPMDGACRMECVEMERVGWSVSDGECRMERVGWSVSDGASRMECFGWDVSD
jgi:hypothetical protein